MSDNVLYWVYMGLAAAAPFVLGVWIMRRTNRLTISFWMTTALNVAMTAAAALWWKSVSVEGFKMMFGVAFYGVSCVNVMVLELFALYSIRKKIDA